MLTTRGMFIKNRLINFVYSLVLLFYPQEGVLGSSLIVNKMNAFLCLSTYQHI